MVKVYLFKNFLLNSWEFMISYHSFVKHVFICIRVMVLGKSYIFCVQPKGCITKSIGLTKQIPKNTIIDTKLKLGIGLTSHKNLYQGTQSKNQGI